MSLGNYVFCHCSLVEPDLWLAKFVTLTSMILHYASFELLIIQNGVSLFIMLISIVSALLINCLHSYLLFRINKSSLGCWSFLPVLQLFLWS